MIASARDWLLEVSGDPDRPGSAAPAAFALLAGWGYGAFRSDGQRLRRRPPGGIAINNWFLAPEQVERLGPERAPRPLEGGVHP